MDGDALINAIWEARRTIFTTSLRSKFERESKSAMVEILKGDGYFVCETTDELRVLAIDETDLVEPNAE